MTAAWLKFPGLTLESLAQRCCRLEDCMYRCGSGNDRFVADLRVARMGFVVDYPGIWQEDVDFSV